MRTPPEDRNMSAPRRKKKSATDLIQELIDKNIQSKMEKVFENFEKYLDPPTSNTITNTIGKKHTLYDDFYGSGYQGIYNTTTVRESDSKNVAPQLRIIDETKTLPMEQMTSSTHHVMISIVERGGYEEKIIEKLVGKETVEWWELVLLYGFGKMIKTEVALEKNKDLIKQPSTLVQLKRKDGFLVQFHPSSQGKLEKVLTKIEGEDVYKLIGTKYVKQVIILEIPYDLISETTEYTKDGLIYEKHVETLQPNYTEFLNSLEGELNERKISQDLKLEILRQIYGRLRRI